MNHDDREAIKAVKARYCRFLDTKDWEGYASLFTEDLVLDVTQDAGGEVIRGRDAAIAQIRQVVTHARTAHQVHSPEIDLAGDVADVIWAMQDRVVWAPGHSPIPGIASITGFGHYHERYVRWDGVWKIAALRLTRLYVETHPDPAA
jgi:ketosteroid isomerase-like protein